MQSFLFLKHLLLYLPHNWKLFSFVWIKKPCLSKDFRTIKLIFFSCVYGQLTEDCRSQCSFLKIVECSLVSCICSIDLQREKVKLVNSEAFEEFPEKILRVELSCLESWIRLDFFLSLKHNIWAPRWDPIILLSSKIIRKVIKTTRIFYAYSSVHALDCPKGRGDDTSYQKILLQLRIMKTGMKSVEVPLKQLVTLNLEPIGFFNCVVVKALIEKTVDI